MQNKDSTCVKQDKSGRYGCVSADKKVVVPFEYDYISIIKDKTGRSLFFVNKDTTFGIFDLEGNEVVNLRDAVNRPKLSEEVKQMFKIVYEYSLHREETQQLLFASFRKQCSEHKTDKNQLNKLVLYAIFHDFIVKCYMLDTTKKTLLDVLTDSFVGINSPFQEREGRHFIYSDIMERLIDIINDKDWFIHFFTDYINEILPLSKITNEVISLETADWKQYIIRYLMGIITEEVMEF